MKPLVQALPLGFVFLLLSLITIIISGNDRSHRGGTVAAIANGAVMQTQARIMFVFGDSYADTGNHPKGDPSWEVPYGITWPGTPTGRFGNGRVLTDFIVEALNLSSPVPFRILNESTFSISSSSPTISSSGVNFAYGGSGMFYTFGKEYVNLSTQVGQFKEVAQSASLDPQLIQSSSLVLLTYAGNDYIKYAGDHGSTLEVLSFVPQVTSEIASNLRSLYEIGFRSFILSNMEPAGCLPPFTRRQGSSQFESACNETGNVLSQVHNQNLGDAITSLERQLPGAKFMVLDQFSSFTTILSNATAYGITQAFAPCCLGNGNHTCGNVDGKKPLYTVCRRPDAAFFWDNSHPTQAGWSILVQHFYAHQLLSNISTTSSSSAAAAASPPNPTESSSSSFLRVAPYVPLVAASFAEFIHWWIWTCVRL